MFLTGLHLGKTLPKLDSSCGLMNIAYKRFLPVWTLCCSGNGLSEPYVGEKVSFSGRDTIIYHKMNINFEYHL